MKNHPKRPSRRRLAMSFLLAWLCLGPVLARGFQIIPTFSASVLNHPQSGAIQATIYAACFEYQQLIADPVTVRITFVATNSGLGMSQKSSLNLYTCSAYRSALAARTNGYSEASTFVSNLPDTPGNPANGNTNVWLAGPLQRAIGLSSLEPSSDGTVWFNTDNTKLHPNGSWNFDTLCLCYKNYSLYKVLCHEINEILGLGSALNGNLLDLFPTGPVEPQDLWRFNFSGTSRSFNNHPSTEAWFGYALGGFFFRIVRYNQEAGGDFGDWFDDGNYRVQDAVGTRYDTTRMGSAELQTLRAIGFRLHPQPTWFDPDGSHYNGDYFEAWNNLFAAGSDVDAGASIMIRYGPTLHHVRLSPLSFGIPGKPVKLTSFGGTTRIVP